MYETDSYGNCYPHGAAVCEACATAPLLERIAALEAALAEIHATKYGEQEKCWTTAMVALSGKEQT